MGTDQKARKRPMTWTVASLVSVLALYYSAPYVRELQIMLRRALQDYFDSIFKGTVGLLGAGLLVSGIYLELHRAKGDEAGNSRRLGLIMLRKVALIVLVVVLYYFGLFYAICTNPARGVRIIEFIHLFEYSLITILVLKAVSGFIHGYAGYLAAFLLMYLVGLGDEAVQGYIARRVGEFRDIRINAIVAGLALISAWAIFSPRSLSAKLERRQVRPILILTTLCVLASAAFILCFHIGYRIENENCGVLYSLYSEKELLDRSSGTLAGPLLPPGGSVSLAEIRGYWAAQNFYETEAHKHLAEREKLRNEGHYWGAFCEEQIRQIYYSKYTNPDEWKEWTRERMTEKFGDYDTSSFVSFHHDLVFRGWKAWHVLTSAFAACVLLLIVGIFCGGTRGEYADI
ncbi:MAG: VanZ family protein [Candidatus Coatesbacteria bacterium]|nr:VanZ family protein [Candidatus Coatesbacteria bacterium]